MSDEPTAGVRDSDTVKLHDYRYWQEVILRADQVDLIARRVVELLGVERPIPLTPPVPPELRWRTKEDIEDAPGIRAFVEHHEDEK